MLSGIEIAMTSAMAESFGNQLGQRPTPNGVGLNADRWLVKTSRRYPAQTRAWARVVGETMEAYCCGYCWKKYKSIVKKCACGQTKNQVLQR